MQTRYLKINKTRQLLVKPEEGISQYDFENYFNKSIQIPAFVDLWMDPQCIF